MQIITELNNSHLKIMEEIQDGATVFGYEEAKLIREIQEYNSNFVCLVGIQELEQIEGVKYQATQQLPYFGAILTETGRRYLAERENE